MKVSLKLFILSCCAVPLWAASGVPVPLADHPPVDAAALHSHEQEMAFLTGQFRENPDNKVIWQADHKAVLVWRTPRGANFNSYEFKAFLRQKDGSFKETGKYSVMSSYGYWDEKNIQFSDKGFQIVLIADEGATQVRHQFLYSQPAATYTFRLGREEKDGSQ
jgi:hypothetical protein